MNTLTDIFLDSLRKQKSQVSVFLISGIKLHGIIEDFDDNIILLHHTFTQLIFKHSISTIMAKE